MNLRERIIEDVETPNYKNKYPDTVISFILTAVSGFCIIIELSRFRLYFR